MFHLNDRIINVNREELKKALLEGLESHRKEYRQALSEFEQAVKWYLKDALARVEAGDFSDYKCDLTAPRDYSSKYEEVIKMMEYSVDEVISLDSASFRAYVMGDWDWKPTFEAQAKSISGFLSKKSLS